MGGDMPLILDEISIRQELEIHGIQGAVVVTVQRIRPTKNDGDEFPTDLIDQSIGMIGVYPRNSKITPFYLNAKQTLEYTKDPQGRTIDIYGRTHRYDVKCAESPQSELHIMQHRKSRRLSIGHFEFDSLRRCIDSVHINHPEFFT
jgi:hypothetical protein